MKQLIIIIHLISGSILEVTEPKDVRLIKSYFTAKVGGWDNICLKGQEICCLINNTTTHITMNRIEYIEEKYIEVEDKIVEKKTKKFWEKF